MEKNKNGFISKMIKHIRGLGKEMNTVTDDIAGLQQRLILKREVLRLKAIEKENNKKVRKLNESESKR